ncbi:hypothetical protein [Bdellovibrio sp. HCB288]|uniref:hypothetical protein n=1 Tax=Bdellovibrio sp. HCB288 TaxID=3394355 RepID=UPI0039B48C65
MKLLAVGFLVFGMSSFAMAAGLNCKNEAAGYAITQVVAEMIKTEKSISSYKFKAERPVTDDAIELKGGHIREFYNVDIQLFEGQSEIDVEHPATRTVRVQILNTNSGACELEKVSKSDGE